MTTFTHSWTPGVPADSEDINLGAQRIRDFKTDIQERVAVDHSFAGDANDGLHLHVEFMPQNSTPTPVNATDGTLYTQVISGNTELLYLDSSGNVRQLTSDGGLAPQTVNGDLHVTDAVFGATATFTGTVDANIFGVLGGDGLFYMKYSTDLSPNPPIINFTAGCYLYFDLTLRKFFFFVDNVLAGEFPP